MHCAYTKNGLMNVPELLNLKNISILRAALTGLFL